MIPVRLELSGFLSYKRATTLDFTTFHLACISGPNGAGKSSLLDAITWALFGQARRRDDAIIHATADAAQVTFIFDLHDARYRVRRARKRNGTTRLELQIWDATRQTWRTLSERHLRETQAQIEALIGLDYRTFVQASFFLQGQADNFARQSPAGRKETLARILGLDQWELFAARAREARRRAEGKLEALETELAAARRIQEQRPELEAQREQQRATLQRLAEQRRQIEQSLRTAEALQAQMEVARQRVAVARQAVEQAKAEVRQAEERLAALQAEQAALQDLLARAAAIQEAAQRHRELQERLRTMEQLARRYRRQQTLRDRAEAAYREARARVEQELRHLREQAAAAEKMQTQWQHLQQTLARLEEQLRQTPEPDIAALQQEREALTAEQARLRAENADLRAQMDTLKERIERLRGTTGATCPLCGQPLREAQRADLIARLEAEGKALAEHYRANQERLRALQRQASALQTRLKEAQQVQQQRQQWERERAARQAQAEALQARLTTWQQEGAPRLAQLSAALAQETFAPELRARWQQAEQALQALGYDPEAHAHLETEWEKLAQAAEDAKRLAQAQTQAQALSERLRDWELHREKARQRLQQAQDEAQAAEKAYAHLQAQAPDLDALQRQWHALMAQERAEQQALGALEQRLAFVDEQTRRVQTLTAQRADLVQRIARYREVEHACSKKGVPALLIEQALPHIEAEANELLGRLTDGEMRLTFRTQAPYKDRKRTDRKETLDIIVSDAHGERPYETFSGGEAFRINFALRLALARVLARRAGTQIRLLVIDEGFGSQDAAGRQRLVEAINRIRDQFSHILVITHIDELREQFPVHIEVEKTPEGSRLQIVSA